MIVRKLRLQRAWSQDQLAEIAGLSVRTIQRLERGQKPSLETSKALAAVFEVDLSTFTFEDEAMMNDSSMNESRREQTKSDASLNDSDARQRVELQPDEEEAMNFVKGIKDFWSGVGVYLILAVVFAFAGFNEPVVYWVFAGLGIGLVIQGLLAYDVIRLPFQNWEKRAIERRLGRKL